MVRPTALFDVPENIFGAGRRKEVLLMPEPHTHSQVELNFMLQGSMTYDFQGREIVIAAGEFVFFWGAIPHQTIRVDPGTTFVCIYVPLEMFLSMPLSPRLSAAVLRGAMVAAEQTQPFDPDQLLRLHAELLGPDSRMKELDRTELEIMLRRVDLLGWRDLTGEAALPASRAAAQGHEKACAMARFMAAHAEQSIGVEDVARAVGLHPNYAMSLFRRALGTTIGAYLTRQRLHVAQQKLVATRTDITTIAFDCGFGSVSRFYEAFGRHFGMSPHRYRQTALARATALDTEDWSAAGPAV